MEYFETRFENKSKGTIVVDEGGKELLTLQPGDKKMVESRDAGTSYAAFSKIVYEKDGHVSLSKNHDWRLPLREGMLLLEILNVDGSNCEQFYDGFGESILCYRGIPRHVAIRYDDAQWALVEKLTIQNIEHTSHSGDFVVRKNVLERVKTMRSKSEVKSIMKYLVDQATAKAKQDLKRRFPSAEL